MPHCTGYAVDKDKYQQDATAAISDSLIDTKDEIEAGMITVGPPKIVQHLAQFAFMSWTHTIKDKNVLSAQIRAIEMLGRYFKMFTDKVEIAEKQDLANELAEALRRVNQRGQKAQQHLVAN